MIIKSGKRFCDNCGKELIKKYGSYDYVCRKADNKMLCWHCYDIVKKYNMKG